MVVLNRIVAVAMVRGREIGPEQLAEAEDDPALAEHHRTNAVPSAPPGREMAGDEQSARDHYRLAACRTLGLPERRLPGIPRRGPDYAPRVTGTAAGPQQLDWGLGHYERTAAQLAPVSAVVVERAAPQAS